MKLKQEAAVASDLVLYENILLVSLLLGHDNRLHVRHDPSTGVLLVILSLSVRESCGTHHGGLHQQQPLRLQHRRLLQHKPT